MREVGGECAEKSVHPWHQAYGCLGDGESWLVEELGSVALVFVRLRGGGLQKAVQPSPGSLLSLHPKGEGDTREPGSDGDPLVVDTWRWS
jgi:hypothetical protein